MSKIKAVIFDTGGVLVSWPKKAVYDDLKKTLNLDNARLKEFGERYLWPFSRGEISEIELWQKANREFGIRKVSTDENLIGRTFEKESVVHQEVVDYAASLKKRGLIVAVLSNTNSIHTDVVKRRDVYSSFDKIYLSHEIGLRKPDETIYKHVLKELGLKPDQIIFVDDGSINIAAAKKMGMHTVLAKTSGQIVKAIERLLQ